MAIWHTTGWGTGEVFNQVPSNTTKVWGLVLNPMRGRVEEQRLIALSDNLAELQKFLSDEQVTPYKDEEWHRSYRKDGPLAWCNPPGELISGHNCDSWGFGICEFNKDGWRQVA